MKLWDREFVHRYDAGFQSKRGNTDLWPRVDLWNADENGEPSTWVGALYMDPYTGEITEKGEIPGALKRSFIIMLGKTKLWKKKR